MKKGRERGKCDLVKVVEEEAFNLLEQCLFFSLSSRLQCFAGVKVNDYLAELMMKVGN